MAGRQIEKIVEDEFIYVLGLNAELSGKVRRWRDASSSKSYPICLVHATEAFNEPFAASIVEDYYQLALEIGVQTRNCDDKGRATTYSLLGAVRDAMSSSSILSSLSNAGNAEILGIIPQGGMNELDGGDYNQMSITLQIHARYRVLPTT